MLFAVAFYNAWVCASCTLVSCVVFLMPLRAGFLFRAQPTLMTKEQSAEIMDAIFESPEEEGRGRLLRIMQDFLISESEKHSAKEKGKGSFVPGMSGCSPYNDRILEKQKQQVRGCQHGRTGWKY